MNNWERAGYLIVAKKVIDSLMYIELYEEEISNIDLHSKIKNLRHTFYLNCCYVLDNSNLIKKEICEEDSIIKRIYYERDKNTAHKDTKYRKTKYELSINMINEMKKQLKRVKEVCEEALPEVLTLDFIPYDGELFRFINGITPKREEEIKRMKHPNYIDKKTLLERENLEGFIEDAEDIKDMSEEEKGNMAVLMENGICIEEGLQARQDACIKINILYDRDVWVTPQDGAYETIKQLQSMGYLDIYGIPKKFDENDFYGKLKFITDMDKLFK